jgi:hypothetical protein
LGSAFFFAGWQQEIRVENRARENRCLSIWQLTKNSLWFLRSAGEGMLWDAGGGALRKGCRSGKRKSTQPFNG